MPSVCVARFSFLLGSRPPSDSTLGLYQHCNPHYSRRFHIPRLNEAARRPKLPRAAVGARGHAGVGSLVLVRVSFQFLLIPPVPSLVLCLSLCVVGKVVLDMSNLAAISDMHGRSPLVCVRVFFSLHPLFFLSVSIPYAKRMPFPPLVYRDDISSSITSWHIAISCS